MRRASAAAVFLSLTTLGALGPAAPAALAAERVVLGFAPSLTSALDVIADSQGFFAAEGLQAELREFTRGSKALEALLKGEIDISSSTAYALAVSAFAHPDLRVVATVATAGNDNRVVARRDRGIQSLSDLKGKTVGVVKGGMSQYVLSLLLLQAGLTPKDLTIVFDEPPQLAKRFGAGEFDALCLFGGWLDQVRREQGGIGVEFADESLVRITTFMATTRSRLAQSPALFTRVARAYIRAEGFIHANPDRSLEILVNRFRLDPEAARKLWKPNLFHVALDQSLLGDLDNMARWLIESGEIEGPAPDFLQVLWLDTLKGIDPKRVSVIH